MPSPTELLRPWRRPGELWWNIVHLVTGVVTGVIACTAVVVLGAVSLALLVTLVLALPVIWLLFGAGTLTGRVERSRFAALLDEEIENPVPPLEGRTWWARFKERFGVRSRRRELGYALLRLPLTALDFLVLHAVWTMPLTLVGLPFYVAHFPGGQAEFWLSSVTGPAASVGGLTSIALAVFGLVVLVLGSPRATRVLVLLDLWAARRLLGPPLPDPAELGERVARLEASRSAAVDTAEAERRRIERDLHDGAQQRLVALAVNLGDARAKLDHDPEVGRQLVADAHQEAKEALKEIRDLVRGIHPVILEDRGLDAALSSVVARTPIPVDLRVDVAERPSGAVESAVYFVVTEALTNVARHARADRATVTIVRAGPRLVVDVSDDGVGGAAIGEGTGLAGLRDRVEALDGRMDLVSPPGGPTTLMVEVSCGS